MKTSKKCKKCGLDKNLTEFRNQSSTKDKKKSYCIECDDKYNKEHYEKNKEWRKLKAALWNENNPEKVKEYQERHKNRNSADLDF